MNDAKLQDLHCDWSRGTNKGARIFRNIGEVARFFPLSEPVLCVGCGDGLEVQAWRLLGYRADGIDISVAKRKVAESHGVPYTSAPAEDILADISPGFNVYCAHTLEHLLSPDTVMQEMRRIVVSVMCIIVPIEAKGSNNPSHLSPVLDLSHIRLSGNIEEVMRCERWNNEPEGIIVWRKK